MKITVEKLIQNDDGTCNIEFDYDEEYLDFMKKEMGKEELTEEDISHYVSLAIQTLIKSQTEEQEQILIFAYVYCGILYMLYTFSKILINKEQFLFSFEQEFENTNNLGSFMMGTMPISIIAWPMMIVNEINNNRNM